MTLDTATARVAILLATYNGAAYLAAQLDSLAAQDHGRWCLHVSDDGSTDATLDMLRAFQAAHGADKVTIRPGPQQGFARNFMSLLLDATIDADFYAFADQDDVWHAGKLSGALRQLRDVPPARAALVCGPSILIDASGKTIGPAPAVTATPGIRNALVENIAGGNTMLFNRAARDLARLAGDACVPWHDWWLYLAVAACGGAIRVDPVPRLLYRQHGGNAHGANRRLRGVWRRASALWRGQYRAWNAANLTALDRLQTHWTPDAAAAIAAFTQLRDAQGPIARLYGLVRAGLRRQSRLDQGALYMAALFGKV